MNIIDKKSASAIGVLKSTDVIVKSITIAEKIAYPTLDTVGARTLDFDYEVSWFTANSDNEIKNLPTFIEVQIPEISVEEVQEALLSSEIDVEFNEKVKVSDVVEKLGSQGLYLVTKLEAKNSK